MVDLTSDAFLQCVRDKQFHFFGNIGNLNFTWHQFLKLLKTHPDKHTQFTDEALRFSLLHMERRGSIPRFAKDLCENLQYTFTKNQATMIAFGGLDMDHRSFKVHRDAMDVLYVQVLGSIEWTIWETDRNVEDFYPHDNTGTQIWKQTMVPGDAIWIPRGTFHHVKPLSGRVGFSFGVERKPDPSTYI